MHGGQVARIHLEPQCTVHTGSGRSSHGLYAFLREAGWKLPSTTVKVSCGECGERQTLPTRRLSQLARSASSGSSSATGPPEGFTATRSSSAIVHALLAVVSLAEARALFLCQSHVVRQNLVRSPHACAFDWPGGCSPSFRCIISGGAFSNQHRPGTIAWSARRFALRKAPTSERFLEAYCIQSSSLLTAVSQFEKNARPPQSASQGASCTAPGFQKTAPFTLIFRASLPSPREASASSRVKPCASGSLPSQPHRSPTSEHLQRERRAQRHLLPIQNL